MTTLTNKQFSNMVNDAIITKTNNPTMDTNKLVEEIVSQYTKDMELSENQIGDLLFQVSVAVVNHFR